MQRRPDTGTTGLLLFFSGCLCPLMANDVVQLVEELRGYLAGLPSEETRNLSFLCRGMLSATG